MTFGFGFCSVLPGRVSVRFGFLHVFFTFGFGFGSVFLGSGSFPSLLESVHVGGYATVSMTHGRCDVGRSSATGVSC